MSTKCLKIGAGCVEVVAEDSITAKELKAFREERAFGAGYMKWENDCYYLLVSAKRGSFVWRAIGATRPDIPLEIK